MNRCFNCGYMWADRDDDGVAITGEYCHYVGPDDWAPCAQDDYDEYANEAYIEEEAAREEAEYEDWLDSLPEELRPTNAHEYVESWKRFRDRFEEPTFEEYGAPYDYQEFQEGVTMERIVRVWIGNDFVEYEIEDNGGWTEDELYEAVAEDVYNSISIEILQKGAI